MSGTDAGSGGGGGGYAGGGSGGSSRDTTSGTQSAGGGGGAGSTYVSALVSGAAYSNNGYPTASPSSGLNGSVTVSY